MKNMTPSIIRDNNKGLEIVFEHNGQIATGTLEVCDSKIELVQLNGNHIVFIALTAIGRDLPENFRYPKVIGQNMRLHILPSSEPIDFNSKT